MRLAPLAPLLAIGIALPYTSLAAQTRSPVAPHPSILWAPAQADTIPTHQANTHTGAIVGGVAGALVFQLLLNAGCGLSENSGCVDTRSSVIALFSGAVLGALVGETLSE